MNEKLKDEKLDSLFGAILKLETIEECYNFFDDLCTITEIKSICQRFYEAKMLDKKSVYTDIEKETGASSATISRVNRCLTYGSGGYRLILDRLNESERGKERT